ncbi:hypothetical protein SCHPADRAFT_928648 [Schizopora paradoxa]|uniref:Protein kinase domain-containing protein n=1 Tax=Schizopora paradoxa TaxID=27342 RepID=A0A0H2RMS6_9AGAM|nr:hypothetical protein SCHPADRAFT_928648 [Schizopora paradoxa]
MDTNLNSNPSQHFSESETRTSTSNKQPSKPSIPNSLRISLPEYGTWKRPQKEFSDVVEVFKDTNLGQTPNCSVPSLYQDAPIEIPLSFMQCIKRKGHYGVCRTVYDSHSVIIKFVFGCENPRWFALEREAKHYNSCLLPVQGAIVPVFYGSYRGASCNDRRTPVSCLILEDCGDRLTQAFRKLPLEERVKILKIYCELHTYKVALNDFAERNVVQKNGTYRLVDFEDINDNHQCLYKGSLYEGMTAPNAERIGCSYVMTACEDMNLWKQPEGLIRIDHHFMNADGFPSQEDIDILCNNVYFGVSPLREDDLHKWLKGYKRIKDKTTPEDYARSRPNFEY